MANTVNNTDNKNVPAAQIAFLTKPDDSQKQGNISDVDYDIIRAQATAVRGLTRSTISEYHRQNARMTIVNEDNRRIILRCHYDPTEFSETYTANWSDAPIAGRAVAPAQFQNTVPREWMMKLLFITLGEEQIRATPNSVSVDSSIELLRSFTMPLDSRNSATGVSAFRPPILNVFLISQGFRCVLTNMTVVRKAIHPLLRFTTKAEIDVTFREFVETAQQS